MVPETTIPQAPRTPHRSGPSFFWPSLVAALLGAGALYQHEGGKIFGPEGLGRFFRAAEEIKPTKKRPSDPLAGLGAAGTSRVTLDDLGSARAPERGDWTEAAAATSASQGFSAISEHHAPGSFAIEANASNKRKQEDTVGTASKGSREEAPPPRVLDQFEALKRNDPSSCQLVLVQKEERALEDIDASIELRTESGGKSAITRFWSSWRPNEEKVLPASENQGHIQKIYLTGTARSGYESVKIDVELYARERPGGQQEPTSDSASSPRAGPRIVRFTPALEDPSCVSLAIDALKSGGPEQRRKAALALWNLGPVSKEIEPALIRAVSDGDYLVRWRAAGALSRFNDPSVVSALVEATKDRTTNLPNVARWSLAKIGAPAMSAIPTLVESVKGGKADKDDIRYFVTSIINDWHRKRRGEREIARDESLKGVIPSLITLLKDADDHVREESAHALWSLGTAAADAAGALVGTLNDKCEDVRVFSRMALGELGPAAVPSLVEALKSPVVEVRRTIVGILQILRRDAQGAVLPLVLALKDPDEQVRGRAASALGGLGPEAMARLIDALKAHEDILRDLTHEELWMLSETHDRSQPVTPDTVPALIAALQDQSRPLRRFAMCALGKVELEASGAIPTLLDLLKGQDTVLRREAIFALSGVRPVAKDVLTALIDALKEDDKRVRGAAIEALGSLEQAAEPALPALLAILKDGDKDCRDRAARALGSIRQATPEVVRALADAFDDPDESVRRTAMSSVQMLGPAAKEAEPALIAHLKDVSPAIRREAMYTLGRIGPAAKDAVRPLLEILNNEEDELRDCATFALGEIGAVTADVVEGLTKAMRYGRPSVRSTAARVLIRIEPVAKDTIPTAVATLLEWPEAGYRFNDESLRKNATVVVAALVASLDHPDPAVVRLVIKWLGMMKEAAEAAVPALVARLDDEDGETRMSAVKALGSIGPAAKGAVPRLIDLLHDLDPKFVEASAYALGEVGTGARAAIGPLAAIWKSHPDESARGYARSALAQIEPGLYGR
jgi:HEAT repeat protein